MMGEKEVVTRMGAGHPSIMELGTDLYEEGIEVIYSSTESSAGTGL